MSESTAVAVDTHTLVWYVDGDARLSTPARVLDEPDSAFEVYPIDLAVILAAIDAPWRGGDPSDRILAGTATTLQLPLVTRDEDLRQSEYVDTAW